MSRKISIAIIVILIVVALVIAFTSQPVVAPAPLVTGVATSTTAYTLSTVSQHKTAQSCWTAIQGNVYDVTAWIAQHPGGEGAILGLCGRDGTQDFMDQHGGQGKPERELGTYLIGPLI